MRIILPLILFAVLSCSDPRTDFEKYNELEQKAMLQFKDKAFETALVDFEKAIDLKPKEDVSIYFYAAASALHADKKERAKEFLIASIHNTRASKNYFLNFEEFDDFRNEKLFAEIESNYEHHISEFYSKLEHSEIYREVDSLVALDQEYRTNGSERQEWARIDSLNIKRLIEITKEHGWQKKGWLLLWHQRGTYGESNYVWDFFKPYLDEEIKNGRIDKDFWAMFDEEKSIRENGFQKLGLYWNNFNDFPIKDIEKVDQRRAEYGLPPLSYMNKVYGIEFPSDYKPIANN